MIEYVSADDSRLQWYRGVRDPALLHDGGRFVAEGRLVVARLLGDPRWDVESALVSPATLPALHLALSRRPDLPVFVIETPAFEDVTGFNIHRGCLAIARRRPVPEVSELVSAAPGPAFVLGLEGLADADNVGSCFRNAAAFGTDAVVLDTRSADPLYRKAIRTSMGASLRVPFTRVASWIETIGWLQSQHVVTLALTLCDGASELSQLPAAVLRSTRVAVMVGNEAEGLTGSVQEACDHRVRIRMAEGEDSLNVATAAAIALHVLSSARRLGHEQEART